MLLLPFAYQANALLIELLTELVGVRRVALPASYVQGRLLTPRIHPVFILPRREEELNPIQENGLLA